MGSESVRWRCSASGYWYPLYAYARRRTGDVAQAQDSTQDFLRGSLEKGTLELASPERGRFRSFLLTAMKNFLASAHEKEQLRSAAALHKLLPLDFDAGESKFRLEPAHELTPERLFERQWTLKLLELVMQRLASRRLAAADKSGAVRRAARVSRRPARRADVRTPLLRQLSQSEESIRQAAQPAAQALSRAAPRGSRPDCRRSRRREEDELRGLRQSLS